MNIEKRTVDAEKVRNIIHKNTFRGAVMDHRRKAIIEELEALLTPSLPTLADMTPEERQACQWMQADVKLANGGSATCVIANPRMPGAKVRVWAPHGGSDDVEEGRVTPLPDLPRLEWPGSGDAPTVAEQENVAPDQQVNPQVNLDSSLPRPEDVPAGEPWIVLCGGKKWVGVRADDHGYYPWGIIRTDGLDYQDVADSEITLISRLVPEVTP